MRQLKVLCGKDQLNNKFIVATNRWEDFQSDDLDDQSSEEEFGYDSENDHISQQLSVEDTRAEAEIEGDFE